jgi:hypothetical protein
MSSTTLHADVQRGRFAQHALSALAILVPPLFRGPPPVTKRRTETLNSTRTQEKAALEAQKVRELAYSYAKTDPGFAADLYAAASRHEGLHDN